MILILRPQTGISVRFHSSWSFPDVYYPRNLREYKYPSNSAVHDRQRNVKNVITIAVYDVTGADQADFIIIVIIVTRIDVSVMLCYAYIVPDAFCRTKQ